MLTIWSHIKSTCPLVRSFIAGPVPRYATVVIFVSIALEKSNPQRCDAEPMPA
jgi:hypothetical protein